MAEQTASDIIRRTGQRIREILDEARQPDYPAGPYRIINTDIDGNPHHYGDGLYFTEEHAREILRLFRENPHQHHQTYECEPELPDKSPSPYIA